MKCEEYTVKILYIGEFSATYPTIKKVSIIKETNKTLRSRCQVFKKDELDKCIRVGFYENRIISFSRESVVYLMRVLSDNAVMRLEKCIKE